MELRHVRYFVAVAEELSFGGAARRVHVAQPALSKQVGSLERELGVKLFDRTKRRIELTDAGRAFLERSYRILEQVGEAASEAARAGRGEVGSLRVGFTGMTLYSVVPGVVKEFGERFPEVEVTLREMCTRTLTEGISGKQVDVGFLHPPVADDDIALEAMLAEPLVAVLPEDHPLSGRPEVSLSELADDPFVLFPRDEGPENYDRIIGLCRASGFGPRIVNETSLPQTVIGLVAADIGVSLVWSSMRNLRRPGVVYIPLSGPTLLMQTALAWRRGDPSAILSAFLDVARDSIGASPDGEGWHPAQLTASA